MFFAMLIIFVASPAHAEKNQIIIDGVSITSDVEPEIRNNRIMVPLRVISENLGSSVNWSDSEVTLIKNDMEVKLKINSNVVMKNGKTELLDATPYMKKNRTFVPLRFLAETFGCTVRYENSKVTVDTEPLFIDGVKVKAVQHEYRMTMGGVVQEIRGHVYHNAIYHMLVDNIGNKVEAPIHYSWQFNMDIQGAYYKAGQYDFLNQEGATIKRFDMYTLIESHPEEVLEEYPKVLVHDVMDNQWYLFSDTRKQSIEQIVEKALNNGFIQIISNTIA